MSWKDRVEIFFGINPVQDHKNFPFFVSWAGQDFNARTREEAEALAQSCANNRGEIENITIFSCSANGTQIIKQWRWNWDDEETWYIYEPKIIPRRH